MDVAIHEMVSLYGVEILESGWNGDLIIELLQVGCQCSVCSKDRLDKVTSKENDQLGLHGPCCL